MSSFPVSIEIASCRSSHAILRIDHRLAPFLAFGIHGCPNSDSDIPVVCAKLSTPADDDLVAAGAEQVATRESVTLRELVGE
jgi:hypothetical protein